MDERDEHRIARGLSAGRPDAWRALYDAYCERVWRAVAHRLGTATADVADVVQETFLAAARSARNYDPAQGPLWAWLWGIARLQVLLHFRKTARRDEVHAKYEPSANGERRDPLEVIEESQRVRATLLELPADYELLLAAKYLEGESVETIAVRQGCTPIAVRSKLARARAAFREAFEKKP